MKYLSDLNMNLNKILKPVLEGVTENPGTGVAGEIKYNTVKKIPIYYDGQNWIELSISAPINSIIDIDPLNWDDDNNYTILNSSISSTNKVTVSIAPEITELQYDTWAKAKITPVSQSNGYIKIHALGDVPTIDIPVIIIVG